MSVMTASTAPEAGHAPGRPRLSRWLVRLHRPALLVWAALVVVGAALLLWLAGPLTDAAARGWRQYDACGMAPQCPYNQEPILFFNDMYSYLTRSLAVLPLLTAAWAGAALVGREMESGTARLTWTQGVTPARWLAAKLALPALAVTAGTSLLVLLHRHAWSAARGRVDTLDMWNEFFTFHANGPTTVAFALAGLAAGAFAGMVWHRTLPALVLGLVLTAGIRVLAEVLMPHLWPAVTQVTSLKEGYVFTGVNVDRGLVTAGGAHIAAPACDDLSLDGCHRVYEKLGAVGYYSSYHPASHFWPLQLTTTALVLALAALLAVGAFLVLRRLTGAFRLVKEAAA